MNKNIIIYVIGLFGLMLSCQKEQTKVKVLPTPIAPTLKTLPDLTLKRANGTDTLVFTGTPVDPGFQASVNYFLEADTAGNQFNKPITLVTGIKDSVFKITVSALDQLLITKFPADASVSVEIRIKAVLVADAGTGAIPIVSPSPAKSVTVSTYGLPRLDIIAGGVVLGKIQSALNNGKYVGFANLNATKPFTLKDPDTNITFGGSAKVLAKNGPSIIDTTTGWNIILVDTIAKTYSTAPFVPSIIGAWTNWGSGTPGEYFMTYNTTYSYWAITIDLPVGTMKFRANSQWNPPAGNNWGPNGTVVYGGDTQDANVSATGGTFALPNSSGNLVITTAGNYTINFTYDGSSASCTFIRNN